LREEIRSNIPSGALTNPDIDLGTILESLPLLNGVCNETLRLYPTVPVTTRVSVTETTVLGYKVPKGTRVIMPPWAINRSPELWGPDAEEFIPDRWIDQTTGKPNNSGGAANNYAIMTFLHGPRSCIGQGFAKAELRCLVAAFVGVLQLDLVNPDQVARPGGMITLKPVGGLKLKLKVAREW
jgi:cytochrome P450